MFGCKLFRYQIFYFIFERLAIVGLEGSKARTIDRVFVTFLNLKDLTV